MAYLYKTTLNPNLLNAVKTAFEHGGWLTVKELRELSGCTDSQARLGVNYLEELGEYLPIAIKWKIRSVPSKYNPKRPVREFAVSELELPTEHDPTEVVFKLLKENPKLTIPAVAKFAMCSNKDTKAVVKELQKKGLLGEIKRESKQKSPNEFYSEAETIRKSELLDSLWPKPKLRQRLIGGGK